MSLNFESQRGYTGKILEHDYFGESVLPSPEVRIFLQKFGKPTQDGKIYLPFHKSIEFIKKFYTQNPHDPDKPIAKDLFQALLKKLNLANPQELSFYSAIDTPLDTFHKIDGFFECENIRLNIDLTANPRKEDAEDNPSVDFVLHQMPDKKNDAYLYKEELDEATNVLAKIFQEKKTQIDREKHF
jgi:hypothetical protein